VPVRATGTHPAPVGSEHVTLGVLAALLSALCYGVASVLQSKAARVDAAATGAGPLLRVMVRAPFVGGLLLDVAGFAAQFAALRVAPVFLVQAAQAASLAVTAAVAGAVLKVRLGRRDWIAVGLVCAGLAALGLSTGAQGAASTGVAFRGALVAVTLLLAGVGWAAGRLREPAGSAVIGLVAGLGFGVVALAARALPDLSPARLVAEPATYALVIGGVVAFLCFARALQRGAVTAVTAALVTGETLLPAVVGILVFGDHTRPGTAPIAVAGFAATLAGAAGLAHFGELRQPDERSPQRRADQAR
jgi:drug/metabolite transporter (DMT)-like permease